MTITLPPKLPEDDRPRDYAGLYAEFRNLEKVISDLLFRLEDNKYRWELYEFGLDENDPQRPYVRTAIDELNTAVHRGGAITVRAFNQALLRVPGDPSEPTESST